MANLWLTRNKIILDARGRIRECPDCPCDTGTGTGTSYVCCGYSFATQPTTVSVQFASDAWSNPFLAAAMNGRSASLTKVNTGVPETHLWSNPSTLNFVYPDGPFGVAYFGSVSVACTNGAYLLTVSFTSQFESPEQFYRFYGTLYSLICSPFSMDVYGLVEDDAEYHPQTSGTETSDKIVSVDQV